MRYDLLHAQASVDWAVAQLPSLNDRINAWLQFNLEVTIKDPDPNVPNNVIVTVEKDPFPLAFNVEAGAYTNAIRSSLDILASSLSARNGKSDNPEAHFPIYRWLCDFIDPLTGLESIKWLSTSERSVIKSLKPYQGGNQLLWSLHQLDIMRKHRRLIGVEPTPVFFRISGWSGTIHRVATGWMRAHGETVLALISKGAPEPHVTRSTNPGWRKENRLLQRSTSSQALRSRSSNCSTSDRRSPAGHKPGARLPLKASKYHSRT
jgi:hypothetical protein